MRTYRVIVHGSFPPVMYAGEALARGFYAARIVVAPSRDSAAMAAFRAIADAPALQRLIATAKLGTPDLAVDEFVDLGTGPLSDEPEPGLIFYDESETDLKPGYYVLK